MAAEDLRALAWLHETERTLQVLVELHRSGFPKTLSLLPEGCASVVQMSTCLSALAEIPSDEVARCNDDLAAEYAAIYLTHAFRAAPYESVWRDEDQLMMQAPTFAVREFYARHGVAVEDWRHQADDHLSHELQFAALLLERGERREVARFLRTHLLTWLPLFTQTVEKRAQTHFYAGLATLTLDCVNAFLDRLPSVAVIPPVFAASPSPCQTGCGSD